MCFSIDSQLSTEWVWWATESESCPTTLSVWTYPCARPTTPISTATKWTCTFPNPMKRFPNWSTSLMFPNKSSPQRTTPPSWVSSRTHCWDCICFLCVIPSWPRSKSWIWSFGFSIKRTEPVDKMSSYLANCHSPQFWSRNRSGQENKSWVWSFLTRSQSKSTRKATLKTVTETSRTLIWSSEKGSFWQVPYRRIWSAQGPVVLCIQHGLKSALMPQTSLWPLPSVLSTNGFCKTVSQSAPLTLFFQSSFKKRSNKATKKSSKLTSKPSTGTGTNKSSRKKLSIKEVRKSSTLLTSTSIHNLTVDWEGSRKSCLKRYRHIWTTSSKWSQPSQKVLRRIWRRLCSVWVIKTLMVKECH